MSSRFVNLFKKDDLDEQRAFQRKVHGIVSRLYPDQIFTFSDDPLTLESDGSVYGLTNLHAKFLLTDQTEATLEELIAAQFNGIVAVVSKADNNLPWEEARNFLMPQLMPEAFVQMAPVELAYKEFVEGVAVGFVIDGESTYSYANVESLEKWGVDVETLYATALENLHARSQGIEMMAFPGDNGFFIINTTDGFDAVRLLSPEMREVIAEHIGSPFYAGIPNRDFLICWSAAGDEDFQDKMRQQISSDFDEQAYPLSRRALEVTEDGQIRFAATTDPDVRAATADLN